MSGSLATLAAMRLGSPDHGSTPTCAWPGRWRTQIAIEQAFSPPLERLPPPRSGHVMKSQNVE